MFRTAMKSFVVTASVLAAGLAILSSPAWAAPKPKPIPQECGLIGTWFGGAGPIVWSALHTAGSTNAGGEMLMNWIQIQTGLLTWYGHFPSVVRLTPGHGVWNETGSGQYNYTWYAYGIEGDGNVVYSVRVVGEAANSIRDINGIEDAENYCNNVSISYVYEVFEGWVLPKDMIGQISVRSTTGEASETRFLAAPMF